MKNENKRPQKTSDFSPSLGLIFGVPIGLLFAIILD